jgi:tetratricopeptide (TPR) repeat protein
VRFIKKMGRKLAILAVLAACAHCSNLNSYAQASADWQATVQKLAQAQNWKAAIAFVEERIAREPKDLEARTWRARLFTWSGQIEAAEKEYRSILQVDPRDPDNWLGLASVLEREGHWDAALAAIGRGIELDPRRVDLRIERGRILRARGNRADARAEFRRALQLEPSNAEARAGLLSVQEEPRQTLLISEDNDLFNFTGANHAEGVLLTSAWTQTWTTAFGTGFFQRGGLPAEKFTGSVTGKAPRFAAITIGGATAHDNGVIPEEEAFFDLDRGWKLGESGLVRGLELDYGQHWYWYTTARILTLSETGVVYLPGDWSWTLRLTQARSHFSGTGIDWKPSGISRVNFPLATWKERALSGNVFYAVGTEDFAEVDQIGSFASQNYGGGLRLQLTVRQEITTYGYYQRRTQGRTQTSFGFSYAIHF